MHFLCLHGAGTNSKIFEMQTAALRHELGGNHTYDFVEGVVEQDKAPGVESLGVSDTSYFGYYKPYCAESFINAIIDLQKYLESDGPFDGIIAFSQGASLASAFVADKPRLLISGLRCGVFFSGRTPFIDSGTESHSFSSTEDLSRAENVTINIPTVHIWGANDRMEPGQAAELSELCLHQEKHIYIHSGGHEVPGPKDKEGLVESVNAIRSMLAQL